MKRPCSWLRGGNVWIKRGNANNQPPFLYYPTIVTRLPMFWISVTQRPNKMQDRLSLHATIIQIIDPLVSFLLYWLTLLAYSPSLGQLWRSSMAEPVLSTPSDVMVFFRAGQHGCILYAALQLDQLLPCAYSAWSLVCCWAFSWRQLWLLAF